MELQTASQVSQNYGISTRMLRYYEQLGLLESIRKEDYAYRVYDEAALMRLQQIIILRKLQIPVKQISVILNNPDGATAIEIFKSNISEIQNEINALSTIKSALEIFVAKIEQLASVRLNLNLLTDESVMKLAESLSLIQRNVREIKTMEELNKANEVLSKRVEDKIRIVCLPPMTVARLKYTDLNPNSDEPYQTRALNLRTAVKKFIDDAELFKIKPDVRFFGEQYHEGHLKGDYELWVTIPDDLSVPAPFTKIHFPGGLYVVSKDEGGLWQWLENSDEYEWAPEDGINRPITHEYFNMYNQYGLKNTYSEEIGFLYLDLLIPIREIKKLTDENGIKFNNLLQNAEKLVSQNKPIEIDLTSMEKHGELDIKYENGLMTISADGFGNGMATQQQFKLPLKIEILAKTDREIAIKYAKGAIYANNEHTRNALSIWDIMGDGWTVHQKCGQLPVDKFVDIEWIFNKDIMVFKINGELRHISDDYKYIKSFKENPDFSLSAPVTIEADCGTTITVKSLWVTEI